MTRVLVFGSFDIIHKGHLYFLKKAKALGDKLYVVVARDRTIAKVKKREPVHKESERKKQLEEISFVDYAVLGSLGDKLRVIEKIKPDIIVLGYDQGSFTKNLKEKLLKRGLKPRITRLSSYKPYKYKSSKIRERINKA